MIKWAVVGLLVAVPAALMAYVGGPIAGGSLAAWASFVIVALAMRHDRKLSGVRAVAARTSKDVTRVQAQNSQLRASIKELKAENTALKQQVAKARSALDNKIAVAVQRIDEKFKAQLSVEAAVIKQVIKDTEIESGLAALNRYTSLAEHGSDPEETASGA